MNGMEALKKIIEYDSNAKIIMCSGAKYDSIVKEAKNAGALAFITKPFNENNVISTIQEVLKE